MPDFDLRWDYGNPAQEEERFTGLLAAAAAEADAEYHLGLLTQIARAQGIQQRFADAHATLDSVESLLTPDLKSAPIRYLLERGRAFNSDGQRERALPLFLEAFDLALKAGEAYHAVDAAHMVAIAIPGPADQLAWNLRAVELAEAHPSTRRWLGPLYNNIGWTHAGEGRHAEALTMFERCEAFFQGESLPERARIARWCRAKMLRLLDRPAEGLALQEEIARMGVTDGYNDEEIGECLLALGRPDESRQHFNRAYELLAQDPRLVRNEPARLERLKALGQ